MRNLDLKTLTFTSSLLALTAALATAAAGCSTGSDTPATGTPGAAGTGTTGAAGAGTTGAAGAGTTGAAGAGTTGAAGAGTTGAAGAGTTGAAGAGTTGAAGAPPTTGVCAGTATRDLTLTDSKVDNFEDATLSLGWSTFNDVTVGGMKNTIKMTVEAGGAAGTAHSAHYVGTGAAIPSMGGYGVGAIYNAAIDKANNYYCVNITVFDGISFWAKGKVGTHLGVNFVVPATNAVADGGDCTMACYNHPQKAIALTADWMQYTVPFSAAMAGTVKVMGRIQELGWLSPEADWDFNIDEIQFYKGTPPTGAAM